MTTEAEWLALAERCRLATRPDREIDAAIHLALGWAYEKRKGDKYSYFYPPGKEIGSYTISWCGTSRRPLPSPTLSQDAITALIEQTLPGLCIEMCKTSNGSLQVREVWFHTPDCEETDGLVVAAPEYGWPALPPPRALTFAFCLAMAKKEPTP